MIPYNYRRIMRAGQFSWILGMRMWLNKWPMVQKSAMEELKKAVPVDVTPITHILNEDKLPHEGLFPPWENFYFEKTFPFDVESKEFIKKIDPTLLNISHPTPSGILVKAESIKNLREDIAKAAGITDGARWAYTITGLHFQNKQSAMIEHKATFFVTGSGRLICHDAHKEKILFLHFPAPGGIELAREQGWSEERIKRETPLNARADITATLRFISFMQARNIKAKRRNFPDYKPRKHQRHKVYKYYELTVVKPTINAISQGHGEGVKGKALHSVRGHIRYYTEEKPMFGTPGLSGAFYVAQHVRGDIKHGQITKTYLTKSRN